MGIGRRFVRQHSELWDAAHSGVLTSGRIAAALNMYSETSLRTLGLPKQWCVVFGWRKMRAQGGRPRCKRATDRASNLRRRCDEGAQPEAVEHLCQPVLASGYTQNVEGPDGREPVDNEQLRRSYNAKVEQERANRARESLSGQQAPEDPEEARRREKATLIAKQGRQESLAMVLGDLCCNRSSGLVLSSRVRLNMTPPHASTGIAKVGSAFGKTQENWVLWLLLQVFPDSSVLEVSNGCVFNGGLEVALLVTADAWTGCSKTLRNTSSPP